MKNTVYFKSTGKGHQKLMCNSDMGYGYGYMHLMTSFACTYTRLANQVISTVNQLNSARTWLQYAWNQLALA